MQKATRCAEREFLVDANDIYFEIDGMKAAVYCTIFFNCTNT